MAYIPLLAFGKPQKERGLSLRQGLHEKIRAENEAIFAKHERNEGWRLFHATEG